MPLYLFKRLLLGVVLMLLPLYADRPETVFQRVTTGGNQTLNVSSHIRNIGQGYHLFFTGIRDAPGQTCPPDTIFQTDLRGSLDGTNEFSIPSRTEETSPIVGSPYIKNSITRAWGSFPYIRAATALLDTTQCVVDVLYSGTFQGTSNLSVFPPIYQFNSLSSAGDNTILNATSGNGYCIAGLFLYNTTAAQTVIIKDGAGTEYYRLTTMPAGFRWELPVNSDTYVCLPGNTSLVVNLGAATQVSLLVMYRQP
jgi:hypothetical protein